MSWKKLSLQMKNLNKIIALSIGVFLIYGNSIISQGLVLTPLESLPLNSRVEYKTSRSSDSLSIPFFEDFSYQNSYPDNALWLDRSATVSSTLALRPPGYGIATLDGTDSNGKPYQATNVNGAADTLTSKPFNWNLVPADSVYMSFYFQPGGLGNFPEFIDSLILEFYNPDDSLWQRVWGEKGEDYPQSQREFKLVMLPLRDSSFLKPGFQFRFRNFAQLNGSWDQWHLDYIRLNSGRNRNDTLMNDVAYMYEPNSLIDFYQSVPMWHFLSDPIENMLEFFNLSLASLRLGAVNIDYGYNYYNALGSKIDSVTSDPQSPVFYRNEFIMNEAVKFVYDDAGTESTHYDLEYFITNNSGDDIPRNDTIRFQQIFSNYFALDDGSAEARLNLSNTGGGFVAQRFEAWVPDTLKAVQIYFNRTNLSGGAPTFYLMVWAAGANQPGALLLEQEVIYPEPTGLNAFTTITLNTAIPLPAGTYYIGWAQLNNTELNVGFDRNLNNNSRIYYNFDGNWYGYSAAEGTLMMRPVFRYPYDIFVGLPPKEKSKSATVEIYPNPSHDFIRIKSSASSNFSNWIITDLQGRVLMQGNQFDDSIRIDGLNSGIYVFTVRDKQGVILSNRFSVLHRGH